MAKYETSEYMEHVFVEKQNKYYMDTPLLSEYDYNTTVSSYIQGSQW